MLPTGRAHEAAAALWRNAGLDTAALERLALPASPAGVPSSFRIATALQAALGAAALGAAEWARARGGPEQRVAVEAEPTLVEAMGRFRLDGVEPPIWDPLSGLYRCAGDGPRPWVRVHANFAHHRDGVLRLLGLPPGAATPREAVAAALRGWRAEAFEAAASDAGLVVAALRSFDDWDAHPQAAVLRAEPVVRLDRIGDAPPRPAARWSAGEPPLHGLRVLDLTRILAGPVAGRTLAACGADVMLVNGPGLPNIAAIADTSRGKRSAIVDLKAPAGRAAFDALLAGAPVLLQGYRPGALAALGLSAAALAERHPGLVCTELSAYGWNGPWAGRRGFDSLVQTATGFNVAEADAFGSDTPKALPLQALDFSAGHLLAFGTLAALQRQAREGGSWRVRVSLAGVGHWLRGLGRAPAEALRLAAPPIEPWLGTIDSGFGRLEAVRPVPRFEATPLTPRLRSVPPGADPARWD